MRRLLAVLGGDVSRSLSPLLHQGAADALGLEIAYVPVSCPDAAAFAGAVAALQTLGALGANVTIPYKLDALRLASTVSDTAREIGAVNTLGFEPDGTIHGDNTDGPGLVRVLEALPPAALAEVQLLGAGGSARAALWALRTAAAGRITVCARGDATSIAAVYPNTTAAPLAPVPGATLVLSTLPGTPALAAQAFDAWIAGAPYVLDLAYGPLGAVSPLTALARARDLEAQDGKGLLVEQAALALARWTGASVEVIREQMRALTSARDGP